RTLACAGNMKRRIQTLRESIRLTAWICRELSTSESNLWARRLVVLLLLSSLFGTVPGLILARIVNLATEGDLLAAYASMGLLLACYLVQKILEYYQEVARTRVRELAQHNTDARITELFFEKSLGQHIDEGSHLNIANIEKGRGQIPNLISMLISRGVPAIISMMCSFLFLAFLSPFAGAVIAVAIVITALWSMYLNEKVFAACAPVEDELRKMNGYRIERWENTEKVKIFGKEEEEMTYLNAWFRAITGKNRVFWLWVTRQSLWRSGIIVVADLLILAYGLHMVL